jgi:hypothetical protein
VEFGDRGRVIVLDPARGVRNLTADFHSASDPCLSFDAERVLFAGKRNASDRWNIFEATLDGSRFRQVTENLGNCRHPCYQSTLYTIVSPQPWYQITFVSDVSGTANEDGSTLSTSLYSCKLDGSAVRRLTYNLSSDLDPYVMDDGRLVFAAWQRSRIEHGPLGRWGLFGVNTDGADYARFAEDAGKRVKHMPCLTAGGLVVFVETDQPPWDGAGSLGAVTVRRPLHSYEHLTVSQDGLFFSPSPLPDGSLLVSRRSPGEAPTHGVYRFHPKTKKLDPVLDNARYHDIQAQLIRPRKEPDGRSSVVTEEDPRGELYCLNAYESNLPDRSWLPPDTIQRLRILEGLPRSKPGEELTAASPIVPRRILGEIDLSADGSFHLDIPANTPIELQTLDGDGLALRSCGWIWAKNHEPRGCIGCHEDGERTPENVFVDAMAREALRLPREEAPERLVDFRRDIMPIIQQKCAPCHGEEGAPPRLDPVTRTSKGTDDESTSVKRTYRRLLARDHGSNSWGRYVHPGRARTSPLVWHVLGRNTARPWDGDATVRPAKPIPPESTVPALSDREKRTIIEWIDTGSHW